MDLRQFRYFVAVAEEGHVTRAAERLNTQQPPLSRLIRGVEREVGVQLFRRKPRGVELTQAGRAFLDKARLALANADQAVVSARRTGRGEEGHLRIGAANTAPFHSFVPSVIRDFRQAFPMLSLTLTQTSSDDLVHGLRREEVDAAFIRFVPAGSEGLQVNTVIDEALVVAMPSGHRLAPGKGERLAPLPLKALADEPFLMLGEVHRGGLYATTIAACHTAGFAPKLGQGVPHITSALGLIAAGLGISLIPESLSQLQMLGVSYRRIARPVQPKLPLVLASRRGDTSAAVRQFLSLVKRSAKSFPAQ